MKTEVEVKRKLFGCEITQKSKSEFFSATELVSAGNKWRSNEGITNFNLAQYLKLKNVSEFINELDSKYGKSVVKGRGRSSQTWVHPLLFIDIALAINPRLKVEVYEWLFDNLIKFRNDSGDSYKEMSAAIWQRYQNKREFPKYIADVARRIKQSCGVDDWNTATESQLKQRDLIHHSIKLLSKVLTDPYQIVRVAIAENSNK